MTDRHPDYPRHIERGQIWRKKWHTLFGPKRCRVTGFETSAVDDRINGVKVVGDNDRVTWVLGIDKNEKLKGYKLEGMA